jgi:hypothetical protein
MRHNSLFFLAAGPAFGTVVASMIRINRPRLALAQAIQQRHTGNIGEPNRRRPRRGQAQTSLAKTIGQNEPQQIDCVSDLTRAQKRSRLARRHIEHLRSAKPSDDTIPILVHK